MRKSIPPIRSDRSDRPSVAIVGASGLIGHALYQRLKPAYPVLGTYCSKPREGLVPLDLSRRDFSVLDASEVVVIAAGISNIDRCKNFPRQAYQVNVESVLALAEYLADRQIRIVYLSSDQVFDGVKGNYREDDLPNPINEYGRMKWQVERNCRQIQPDCLVLRLSKTYSANLNEGGILAEVVDALRQGKSYAAAEDQIFNPTHVDWISRNIEGAIRQNLSGLYHLADPRIESRYAFACRVAEEHGFDPGRIRPISLSELNFPEARALNSSLNVSKIQEALNEPAI